MNSNLLKLKKSLGVKKNYTVLMEVSEQYEISVEASSKEEAEQLAEEKYGDGDMRNVYNTDHQIVDVQEA